MIFTLNNPENRERFLKSLERMIQATHPSFKIEQKFYSIPLEELNWKDIPNGEFELNSDDDLISLAKNYIASTEIKSPDEYEKDTIDLRLATIKDVVENPHKYESMWYVEDWKELYGKLYN